MKTVKGFSLIEQLISAATLIESLNNLKIKIMQYLDKLLAFMVVPIMRPYNGATWLKNKNCWKLELGHAAEYSGKLIRVKILVESEIISSRLILKPEELLSS